MSLPIQLIFNFYGYDPNNKSSKIETPKREVPKINFNYEAKPYQRRNLNESKYNKGYYCNLNRCGTRSFNGASNKSYKNN